MNSSPIANMTTADQLSFVISVLKMENADEGGFGNLWDDIWWRTNDECAPITFFVDCRDLFYWETADAVCLTPENLPALKQAVTDVRAALGLPMRRRLDMGKDDYRDWFYAGGVGANLFCARERKMRPWRGGYERIPPKARLLFDACGPERDRKDEG